MKKRLPGYVLAVCMAASMLPAAVAEEFAGEFQPACTCEGACTAQTMNEECPVCSMAGAVEQDCAGRVVELCDSNGQDAAGEDGLTPPADADKPVVADVENPADATGDAAYGDAAVGNVDTDVEGAPVPAAALPEGVAAVQALIDALPDAQDVTDEARADLEAQLGAIDEAKAALSDDELAMLDFARYEAAAAALGEAYDLMALEDTLQARISAGGTVVLEDDEAILETLVVPTGVTVTLDLNGYSITMAGNGSVIKVDGGNLILQDSVGAGTITGGKGTDAGGGVRVSAGSFVMNGGTITGCSAEQGGGVYVDDRTSFTMNGGAIVACHVIDRGGGVYDKSHGGLTLVNGTITECGAGGSGGGVYSVNGFTMEGGSITRSASAAGPVVCLREGNLTMSGGVIDAEDVMGECQALHIWPDYGSLVANGGTIRGPVLFDGKSDCTSKVKATVDGAATAFFGTVTNKGVVSAGIYYGELVNYGRVDGKQITFVDPGVGDYAVEVVAADRVSIAPIDPVREGRTFVAWYRDEDCTQEYVFGAAVSEDLTLYAGWDLDTYTVTYASDGLGEGDGGQAVKVHDRDLELAGALFTRDGYLQSAWRDADGSGWPLGGTYGINASTTLYPVWRDVQAPVIGLESGRWYCGEVAFSVTDNESVALVKANGEPLTPGSDGLYRLPAGSGRVDLVAYDGESNAAGISVTVNAGHTPGEDDGDCTTPVMCTLCGQEAVAAKAAHDLVHIDAVAPTHEQEGVAEHWRCSACGMLFADDAASKALTEADLVVAKLPAENKPVDNKLADSRPASAPEISRTGDNSVEPTTLLALTLAGGAAFAAGGALTLSARGRGKAAK